MANKTRYAVIVYSYDTRLRDKLQRLKQKEQKTYRRLLTKWVDSFYESEAETARLRKFYTKNSASWPNSGILYKYGIESNAVTSDRIQELAFKVTGTKSISTVGEAIINYCWAQSGLKLPTAITVLGTPAHTKSSPPKSTDVRAMFTLDDDSNELLSLLAEHYQTNRSGMTQMLIAEYGSDEVAINRLERDWKGDLEGKGTSRRINLTQHHEDMLKYIAFRTTGEENKSATLRALIRTRANKLGVTKKLGLNL